MDNNNYPQNLPGQQPQVIGDSNEVLADAKTVFPFTLFPDTITVDRSKVSVTQRSFFNIGEVVSIRIEDILNVAANVGPFFGSLRISTRFFDNDEKKPYIVNWLTRDDALRMKRIIHGYLVATKQKIDCSALSTPELAAMLDQLGQGTEDNV